jgi:serine/threonine protein kinase
VAGIPERIGKYEVIRRLGYGGMGAVYLARDPDLDRLLAVKVLRDMLFEDELIQRFLREARAAGNLRHAERTLNGAEPFANIPLPGGPPDAPILCCDHEVVIDDASRVLFHTALYFNSTATDGVVRIFVWRTINQATFNCFYDLRLSFSGSSVVLPDFPHPALTKRFLYLSVNAIANVATNNIMRFMLRFPIEQLANCAAVTTQFVTQGPVTGITNQRIWFPAQGTNNHDAMYWAQLDPSCGLFPVACTVLNVFRWLDAVNLPTQFNPRSPPPGKPFLIAAAASATSTGS